MSKKKIIITILIIVILVLMVAIITTNKDNVTYATEDTLADMVITQSQGTTWESGATGVYNTIYTKEDGTTIGSDYRFIGKDVNNHVKFNDDMYQIIGVFDENTHGKTGEKLVKLIRTRILGSYSLGAVNNKTIDGTYSGYYNDWVGSQYQTPANANVLLNEYFYNKTTSTTTYGECSNWTYFYMGSRWKTNNCSKIKAYGIKENLRNYIETATWHLNGYINNQIIANNLYLCERGLYSGCGSANNGLADSSIQAKIGLMYVSDYMYASGNAGKSSTYTGETAAIGIGNWLLNGEEHTITPRFDSDKENYKISSSGSFHVSATAYGMFIRPTFYLKEDVYVTGGNGSFDNPYTIACDTCSE